MIVKLIFQNWSRFPYLVCVVFHHNQADSLFTVCTAGVIEDPTSGYQEGNRFFYFPGDGDGIHHLVDTEEPVDVAFINEYARNPNNNAYWLYTR